MQLKIDSHLSEPTNKSRLPRSNGFQDINLLPEDMKLNSKHSQLDFDSLKTSNSVLTIDSNIEECYISTNAINVCDNSDQDDFSYQEMPSAKKSIINIEMKRIESFSNNSNYQFVIEECNSSLFFETINLTTWKTRVKKLVSSIFCFRLRK